MRIDVFLVRHGEASIPWSQGRDAGLSARGRHQAAAAAAGLAAFEVSDIVTSPLLRAHETAAVYAQTVELNVNVDARFQEVPLVADADRRRAWLSDVNAMQWRDVEPSISEWRAAAWEALCSLRRNTVVFTHFMLINALLTRATDEPRLVAFEPDYGSITHLRIATNGRCELVARGAALRPA